MPDELPAVRAMTNDGPLFVDEVISLDALKAHLTQAAPDTNEIRVTIFEGGTQALEVGTPEGAPANVEWSIRSNLTVDFHTHPSPTDPEWSCMPSPRDITQAIFGGEPIYIGSHLGISVVPEIATNSWGDQLFKQYVLQRGFTDKAALKAYGANHLYRDFILEVVDMRFIPWRNMRAGLALADVALL